MRTIHKFVLHGPDVMLNLPEEAQICVVQEQHDDICLWADLETTSPPYQRRFKVFPTGVAIPEDTREETYLYVGTALLRGGKIVMHVFEVISIN